MSETPQKPHGFQRIWPYTSLMQNDDDPVGTIFSRRDALTLVAKAGLGLSAASLFGVSRAQESANAPAQRVNLVASPALTEGPFFVDEKLNRSDLLEGTTRQSVVKGLPLELELVVLKLSGDKTEPLDGCQVDIWHCDASGVYSDENHPMNHENTAGQKWLRGYQSSNKDGKVVFKTIFPGWYPGRTTHIHFKVRKMATNRSVNAEFTSQLFFRDADIRGVYKNPPYPSQDVPDGTNLRDNIFAEKQVDGTVAGDHLTLELAKSGAGLKGRFVILLTDKTFRSQRGGLVDLVDSWDSF